MNRRKFLTAAGKVGLLLPVLPVTSLIGCSYKGKDTLLSPGFNHPSDTGVNEFLISAPTTPVPYVIYPGETGRSVVDLLAQGDSTITIQKTIDGLMVDHISGLANGTSGHYWEFYVNDQIVEGRHAGNYITHDGEQVEWRYLRYLPNLSPEATPKIAGTLAGCGSGGLVRMSISSPTNLLLQGQKVTIVGKVTDSSGRPLKNELLGVNDGLTRWCTQTRTDNEGSIKYNATVNAQGTAVVEFLVRNYRHPFIFQTATKSGKMPRVNPLNISALAIQNKSSRDLKAITSVDNNGIQYIQRIPKNRTLIVLQTIRDQAMKRVTVFGGGTFSVGLVAGGEVSVTVDNRGVGTISGAAGVLLLRGQVYATTAGALGACWAPGGDLGVTPISLSGEVALCGGTDGISLGANGSAFGVTGGFSIQLLEWR